MAPGWGSGGGATGFPFALADLVGLDVCLAVMEVYFNSYNDSKYRAAPLLREMVAAGRLGRKSGHGVYAY